MKEQSVSRGFAILSLASIIAKILSLLYVPILTRIIGDEGMGIYAKTYEVFVFVYALTNVGLQTAISKYVSELNAEGNYKDSIRAFKISRTILLVIGTAFTLLVMFYADFIANAFKAPGMGYSLMCLAPTVMITSVYVTYKGYFQGRSQAVPIAISTVIEQVVNVVLSLACAMFLIKYSVQLGAAGGTIGSSIGALVAAIYLIYIYNIYGAEKEAKKKQNPNTKRVSGKHILRMLIKYGLPITLSTGLQNLGNLIDAFTISNRLLVAGFTLDQANVVYGLLTARYKTLMNVPMILITSLGYMALPAISRAFAIKDKLEVKNRINFSLRITYIISIPAAFGLAILSKEIYRAIFPNTEGYMIMAIGALAIPLMGIVLIQNVILQSVSQFYYVIMTLIIGMIVKVGMNYYLVADPSINIYGAVISAMIAFMISLILNHIRMRRKLKMHIFITKLLFKPLIASLYMAIGIFIAKYLFGIIVDINTANSLLIMPIVLFIAIIGVFLYIHALIYLGGLRKRDIEEFSPRALKMMPRLLRKHLR